MADQPSVSPPGPPPASEASRWPMRRVAITGVKLAVTLALCWLIVGWIDWTAFLATVRQADYGLIAAVFLLSLAGVAISAWKWQILLEGHGIRYPLISLIRWYFIAAFFNAFLPTNIGGDGYRLLKTYDNPKGRARAVGAILLERITGVLTLGFLGYLAALIVWFRTGHSLAGTLAVLGTIGAAAGLAGFALIWRFGSAGWLSRVRILRTVTAKVIEVVAEWRGQAGRMAGVMGLSFAFHGLRIGFIWLLILALGTAVDPVELTMATFAVEVAAMLPISIGGLGVMEGSFVYVMGSFGLDGEASLAGMLTLRVLTLVIGLIGAVLYLADGKAKPAATET